MDYNKIKELLVNNSFKKEKNSDNYYLISSTLLKESENYLAVTVKFGKDGITISDCGQLLESYDYANLDIMEIRDDLFAIPRDNLYCKGLEIYSIANVDSILDDVELFISKIVDLEKEIEKRV